MDVSARGETVLAELKMLVMLSQQYSASESGNTMDTQRTVAAARPRHEIIIQDSQVETRGATPVKFPRSGTRSRTQSTHTVKQRKSLAASDRTDENTPYPTSPRAPLGIARTVRRTLSGGLTSIFRPFQPSLTKNQDMDGSFGTESHPKAKDGRTLKKALSTTFAKPPTSQTEGNRHHSRKVQESHQGSKVGSLRVRSTKTRARESICSRNSTISILEYLAARKQHEDVTKEENLVPLSEYGRNCHLYGCDSPHIWNPDKNSSRLVVHCDCDNAERSTAHAHIDETPLFYQPGSSTSTCLANPALGSCASSLAENYTEFPLGSSRPSNPILSVDSSDASTTRGD